MHPDIQPYQRTVDLLAQLEGQLEALTSAVSELVSINGHALREAQLKAASSRAMTTPSGKPEMLTQQILRLLRLAGPGGMTANEIFNLILQTRPVHASTVHKTLRRFKEKGMVDLHHRCWHATGTG